MRSKWKRLLLTTMAVGMASSVTAYAANVSMNLFYNGKNHVYNAKEITIEIDGKEMTPKDMPAVAIDGRTMLPMRQIAQELGCEVTWNEAAQQVYVVNDDYTLVFEINKATGYKNGKTFTMDVPPMIVNDRTMLPVRALATALDLDISWDDPSRTVSIETKKAATTKPSTNTTTPSTTNYVTLNKVGVPASATAGQTFTIQANGAIPSYKETIVADNKIVLDFYGTKSGLASKITATNSSIVSAVRTAQHTAEDGTVYTRVVLDLTAKKQYEVTQSADKTKVYVTFDKVTVEDISTKHNDNTDKDVIEIEGDGALGANVFTLANPNRIVVDIPNAISELDSTLNVKNLDFVTAGRTGMFNETTLRIVFEVGDLTEYSYTTDSDSMTLQIYRSTMKNMTYDASKDVLYLQKEDAIKTGSVKFNDHYLDGYFEVVLPGDYEDVYGYGTYDIGDDVIESIQVSTSGGKTTLRFNQNRISCYSIKDDGDRYIIYVKNPQNVYDKVLLLDAGHGGSDPGASGNGIIEKEMNLTIMQKVANELSGSGIKVYVTRDGDVYPSNNSRAQIANQIADAMVSIHMNSGSATANGTEVLYKVHSNDTGSGLTSQILAELIQESIIEATGNNNRGIKHRTDLLILNGTTVPAVIVETVFISNPGDALKISQGAYQDTVAEAIADAIEEAFRYDLR
ncbi:N-acetylmuramoyl-L-alanine amidase family protein [Anaerotignum sp.]|nr:N-acetylmuramoyl-L-alanine amidase family protein [Anaerotignum sp.]MBQ7759016.1 N-acetylmuramoyl-L-alanine amidase [Anaerotignum sp.]